MREASGGRALKALASIIRIRTLKLEIRIIYIETY